MLSKTTPQTVKSLDSQPLLKKQLQNNHKQKTAEHSRRLFVCLVSYLTGKQGATLIPDRLHHFFTKIHQLATQHPKSFSFVCLLYGCVPPLSDDFITIPAGMAKIPYLRVMGPLALGNVIFNITFAYLSVYAYNWVQAVFIG